MFINHQSVQVGVFTQKPRDVNLVSRTYPVLVSEQKYTGGVRVKSINMVSRPPQGAEVYTQQVSLVSLAKNNVVKEKLVESRSAYIGTLGAIEITKNSVIKSVAVDDASYVGGVSLVSLEKRKIVVTNESYDATAYVGAARMVSLVKKRG